MVETNQILYGKSSKKLGKMYIRGDRLPEVLHWETYKGGMHSKNQIRVKKQRMDRKRCTDGVEILEVIDRQTEGEECMQ